MKYIYTFYIWTVAALTFAVIALISVPAMELIGAKRYAPFFRGSMRFLLRLAFVRLKVNNIENIQKGRTYLYMPNHVSILDAVILTAILPAHTVAVEEKRNFSFPVYGWINSRWGNIPIDRQSVMSSVRSFKVAEEALRNGQNMIIFPEGGRTLNGKLKPFKKLLFRTAQQAGQAIMPVALNGVFEVNKKGSIWMTPHKITVNFGKEIPAETVQASKADELSEKTRECLLTLLDEKYQ